MIDEATAKMLARHWDDGWNTCDLETIMKPFATDVVFSSPFVSRLTGDATKTTIEGYEALREYVANSLRRVSGVRYTLDETFVGTDSVILLYTCHVPDGGNVQGTDIMRVDADRKIAEWRCHYPLSADALHSTIKD